MEQLQGLICFERIINNGISGLGCVIDWTKGNNQRVALTEAAPYLAFKDPPGPCHLTLELVHGHRGPCASVWPAAVKWSRPQFTQRLEEGAVDVVSLYFNGDVYYGAALGF